MKVFEILLRATKTPCRDQQGGTIISELKMNLVKSSFFGDRQQTREQQFRRSRDRFFEPIHNRVDIEILVLVPTARYAGRS